MRRALPLLAGAAAFGLVLRVVAVSCGWPARALYDGELEAQREVARAMDRWVEADLTPDDFSTGSARFDGEWLLVTGVSAVLGYGQSALAHPELRALHAERMDDALDAMLAERARAFDAEAWGRDPLDDLGSERPHVAFLAYVSLAAAMTRLVHPRSRHAALEQRIVEHLVARYEAAPHGLCETYPGETYPTDNTAFFGALALHDRASGEDHSALLSRLTRTLDQRYRDPRTGLLYQHVDAEDGAILDGPRGSGTGLAAYFVGFASPALSRSLYDSMRAHLVDRTLGFGTTREYPTGEGGFGDVDSGPVIFGQGVSVTGFTLALARMHGDRDTFVATYATAALVGGRSGGHFALGGPLGDGLLFAFTTALPAERWEAP